MTILDVMSDPELFGHWFQGPSWDAWRLFLSALFALPISGADAALFTKHTGRTTLPTKPAREAWCIAGRRSGKSRIAAAITIYVACFVARDAYLAPGEWATVAIVAADRRQARTVLRYVEALFEVPLLQSLVTGRTKESIELGSLRTVIEIHTANFRKVQRATGGLARPTRPTPSVPGATNAG